MENLNIYTYIAQNKSAKHNWLLGTVISKKKKNYLLHLETCLILEKS